MDSSPVYFFVKFPPTSNVVYLMHLPEPPSQENQCPFWTSTVKAWGLRTIYPLQGLTLVTGYPKAFKRRRFINLCILLFYVSILFIWHIILFTFGSCIKYTCNIYLWLICYLSIAYLLFYHDSLFIKFIHLFAYFFIILWLICYLWVYHLCIICLEIIHLSFVDLLSPYHLCIGPVHFVYFLASISKFSQGSNHSEKVWWKSLISKCQSSTCANHVWLICSFLYLLNLATPK